MKFTRGQLEKSAIWKDPANRALIAEAIGSVRPLGPVETGKPKQGERGESADSKLVESPPSVGYCVTLIVCGRRRMDQHDNLRAACKPLVDAITKSLGFASDDTPLLEWRYDQITGPGQTGCIVKIEKAKNINRRASKNF